jgi:hypothetical protein
MAAAVVKALLNKIRNKEATASETEVLTRKVFSSSQQMVLFQRQFRWNHEAMSLCFTFKVSV